MKPNAPECEYLHVHAERVEELRRGLPDEDDLADLSDLYKVFGDGTRIRILSVLWEAELCVCDIAAILGMTTSAISHQLRVLKEADLVKFRRDGKTVFYSLADDHVVSIMAQGLEHVRENR